MARPATGHRSARKPFWTRPGAETFQLGKERVERFLGEALAIGRQELGTTDLPSLVERLVTGGRRGQYGPASGEGSCVQ